MSLRHAGIAIAIVALSSVQSFGALANAPSGRGRGRGRGRVPIDLPERGTLLFVGDSITWQNYYVAFIEAYLTRAQPARSLRVINRGVRGDTARDVLRRLERDVISANATVIFIMLGVNDGGLGGKSGRLLQTYEQNMERLVVALRAKSRAQIVLLTPTPVAPIDAGRREYNEMLALMAERLLSLGDRLRVATIDVFTPMRAALGRAAVMQPPVQLMADTLHPNPAGHLIIAHHVLAQLVPSTATETVVRRDVCVTDDATVEVPLAHDHRNFYIPTAARSALGLVPVQSRFNGQILKVPQAACAARLVIDGDDLGLFSAEQLARGIDLNLLGRAPWVRDARRDHERIMEKWRWSYAAWDPRGLGSEAILQVGGPAVHGNDEQVRAFALRRVRELNAELAAGRGGGPVTYTLRFVRN